MSSFNPVWLVFLSAVIALVPILAGLMTCYIKMSVVLGLLRNALGAQQVPSQMIIMGLAMAMTLFVMAPVVEQSLSVGGNIKMELSDSPSINELKKFGPILEPWRDFLKNHAGIREIQVLAKESGENLQDPKVDSRDYSLRVLWTAFIITELKQGFAMGFILLLPFLVIDLIVANVLVGMGMTMVSPVMISLPIKVLIFVLSDGWLLLTQSLIRSYGA